MCSGEGLMCVKKKGLLVQEEGRYVQEKGI